MPDNSEFRALLARIRSGDQDAAGDLVRRYETQIRRFIRLRLTDPQVRRVVDSADIFQSVLLGCLVKVIEGRYDLQEPAELLKLLATMASHKIIDHARKPANRKAEPGGGADLLLEHPANQETPSAIVGSAELLDKVAHLLSEEELRIVRRRNEGMSWPELAAHEGTSAEAVRKRYERALQRVRNQLGLAGPDHD
jgi:RNA polymerase sigma-70 factor (ECF subfamily)